MENASPRAPKPEGKNRTLSASPRLSNVGNSLGGCEGPMTKAAIRCSRSISERLMKDTCLLEFLKFK